MAESWKKLRTSNVFSSFNVCKNRNRSALLRELMSNNSLFVGQLYEDKSHALCARDVPINSELLLDNSLLALIYFLRKTCSLEHIQR